MSTVATHRKAFRDYEVLETFEAGIVLFGPEIKSIRNRRVSLEDSFARIEANEVFLYNMHISPYEQSNRFNVEPTRIRKLLLHHQQIQRLIGLLSQKHAALIPLKLYFKRSLAKVELGVCRGKRFFEKRDAIRNREIDRQLRRMIRTRQKG